MLSSKDEFIMLTNTVRKLLQLDLPALKSGLGILHYPLCRPLEPWWEIAWLQTDAWIIT